MFGTLQLYRQPQVYLQSHGQRTRRHAQSRTILLRVYPSLYLDDQDSHHTRGAQIYRACGHYDMQPRTRVFVLQIFRV